MNKQFTMAAIVAVLMSFVCPMTSWAQKVTIDGVKYDFYFEDGNNYANVVGCKPEKQGDLVIPSSVSFDGKEYSVTGIGDRAFSDCIGLTSAVISEGVTYIGCNAFSDCIGLTSIDIPKSVIEIDEAAFNGCTGLTSVVIPEGVTSVGLAAFLGCTGLTSVVIPASVTNIDMYSFAGCTSLTKIEVSSDNKTYSSLGGVLYTKDKSELLAFPSVGKSYVIPAGVRRIGDGAFRGCADLTSLVVPAGVTSIGGFAFDDSGLTSIDISADVTNIGYCAFAGCDLLSAIYCKSATPPNASWTAFGFFEGTLNAVAYVPVGSKAAYEAAEGWNYLTIEEFDFTDVTSASVALPFTAYATSDGVVLSAIEGETEVAVYSLQGVELYRGTVSGGETVVALPSGSYVVRAGNGQGTLVIVP